MPKFEVPATYATLLEKGQLEVLSFGGIEWDRETPAQLPLMRPGLIAFAGNGYGDQYCWYPPWQGSAREPPVLFCPHDGQWAKFFAPDCVGLLERLWLTQPSFHDGADPVELAAWLSIIAPHLEPSRAAALRALLDGGVVPAAFSALEQQWVSQWPDHDRQLLGPWLLSTRYNDSLFAGPKGAGSLRLYDKSIAYFEELVAEGHPQFQVQLADARENRARVVGLIEARAKRRRRK